MFRVAALPPGVEERQPCETMSWSGGSWIVEALGLESHDRETRHGDPRRSRYGGLTRAGCLGGERAGAREQNRTRAWAAGVRAGSWFVARQGGRRHSAQVGTCRSNHELGGLVESPGLEPCHVEGGEPRKLGCKPPSTSSPARGRRLPVQAHQRLTVHRTQDTGGMCASIRLLEAGGQSMPDGPGRGDVRVHGGGGEGEGSVETSGGMGDGGGGRLAGNRNTARAHEDERSATAIAWRSWGSAGGCRGQRGERALVETGDEARTRHSDDGRRSRVLQGMGET